jgi:hypothetical protein
MTRQTRYWTTTALLWFVWLNCLGTVRPVSGQDSGANAALKAKSFRFAREVPVCSYRVDLNDKEMHSVSGMCLGVPIPGKSVIVFSQQMLDAPLHPAIAKWSEELKVSLRDINSSSHNVSKGVLSTTQVIIKPTSRWQVVGQKEGVVFAIPTSKATILDCADSITEPRCFLGIDEQGKLRDFENPDVLVQSCYGGIAIDQDNKLALVTSFKGQGVVYDGKKLATMYEEAIADSKKKAEIKRESDQLKKLEYWVKDAEKAVVQKKHLLNERIKNAKDEDAAAALSEEEVFLEISALEDRLHFAATDQQTTEKILSSIQERLQSITLRNANGAASTDDLQRINEEALKQKQATDLARAKVGQLQSEMKQASLKLKQLQLETQRKKLKQPSTVFLQEQVAKSEMDLAEARKSLEAEMHRRSQVSAPTNLELPASSLKGKPRDEVYRVLETQFMKEREATAQELQKLRERIDRLEQSEREKSKNKEAILNQQIDALLAPE